MAILCTFPGRAGDILWSLPTVRAIHEKYAEPVDLVIGGEFVGLVPLLQEQPYLRKVSALASWGLTPPEEWRAPIDLAGTDYEVAFDLGYRGWPTVPLPYMASSVAGVTIDLERPWISLPPLPQSWGTSCIPVGFTETWFELKVGLLHLLDQDFQYTQEREAAGQPTTQLMQMAPAGSRWIAAGWPSYTWLEAAEFIAASDLFVGDCSALHVLACGLGKRVILIEPMEARHNSIFYPYGMDGPRVTVVKGNDGRPTFDARHCAEAIRTALWGKR